MLEALVKRPVAGILIVAGTVIGAPLLAMMLGKALRPAAKAVVGLYCDLLEEVEQEKKEFLNYKERRRKKPGAFAAQALSEGAQGLLAEGVELEGEESVAEVIVEALEGILG